MRFQSHFNTAVNIVRSYNGSIPLSYFLKQYFAQHKKHGSKDRKSIAHLCYNYYRPGHALKELNIDERLKVAVFLCNDAAGNWYFLYDDAWLQNWSNLLNERITFVESKYASFSLENVFPFADELSEGINIPAFIQSHFIQPDVFLRIRPHKQAQVLNALTQHNIPFEQIEEDCIALPNAGKTDTILKLDEEAVVQDHSSQRIKEFLRLAEFQNEDRISVWDCCAGSGGKSILAYDVLKNIQLTATDIRTSIIQNLKKRFQKAGITNYRSFVADILKPLSTALPLRSREGFDLIICDAPCTGSGTWSRTPEQLYFFDPTKMNEYAALQQKIVSNAIPRLKNGGYFLYITCSVFQKENEVIAAFIKDQFHLQLIKMELIKGYTKKADTMFAALFRANTAAPGLLQ
jgi:16S rRNA (cytosine967-C5)-methyltransferase